MSNKSSSSNSGIGFTGALAILFIAFKILGKIDWSWWWVLSPIWIPLAIALLVIIVMLAVYIVKGDSK